MATKRLIDANVTEKIMNERYKALAAEYGHYDHYTTGYGDALGVVEEAPTVDAVEVVRCKDCKHWLKDVGGCTDQVGRCEWANYMVGANGYCVYGERKDNVSD